MNLSLAGRHYPPSLCTKSIFLEFLLAAKVSQAGQRVPAASTQAYKAFVTVVLPFQRMVRGSRSRVSFTVFSTMKELKSRMPGTLFSFSTMKSENAGKLRQRTCKM